MKSILLSLLLACGVSAQAQLLNSAKFAGEYIGIAFPSAVSCSTERLLVVITAHDDYTLEARVLNYVGDERALFDAQWPFFGGKKFTTDASGLNSRVKGTFTASGRVSGTLNLRPDGGCLYTFKAYRRFKYN